MSPEPVVHLAQIGLGAWGKNLLRNFHSQPGAAMKLVCDASQDTLRRAAAQYPGLATCTDPEEVFRRDDVHAVIIATPPATHYELALKAIESGKDVFVEKPLVLSSADGEKLVRAAEQCAVKKHFEHPPVIEVATVTAVPVPA